MLTTSCATFTCFQSLVDPHRPAANFRHELIDILVIALCGMVCYCETWEDLEDFANEREDWLRKYLSLPYGIPSHDTIGRVISRLDPSAFLACLQEWIDGLKLDLAGKGIHIDGKT